MRGYSLPVRQIAVQRNDLTVVNVVSSSADNALAGAVGEIKFAGNASELVTQNGFCLLYTA